jgi:hypothetical protein
MNSGNPLRAMTLAILAGACVALAGCHPQKQPGNSIDALDNRLVDGAVIDDNAATRELARAIRVDPHAKPARAGRGQPAARPVATGEGGKPGFCLQDLAYSNDWAARLPVDLPLHPRATLQEAAGHDGPCKARVASFTVPGDRAALVGWYAVKAKAAGYSADRDDKNGDWNLTGAKGDAVYYVIAGPTRAGATPVDYVWAQGG